MASSIESVVLDWARRMCDQECRCGYVCETIAEASLDKLIDDLEDWHDDVLEGLRKVLRGEKDVTDSTTHPATPE